MLVLATWVERLGAHVDVPVQGAAELAAARGDHRRDTAYVYPLRETAERSLVQRGGAVQRHTHRVGVLSVVTNRRDPRGEAGLEEIELRRAAVRAALVGWCPEGAAESVAYSAGALVGVADGVLLWQDEFEVPTWETA